MSSNYYAHAGRIYKDKGEKVTEDQKKFFYHLDSMRDGCTKDVLCDYLDKDLVDNFVKDFLEKNYIYETDGYLFINYEKVAVDPWSDVIIN